MTVQWPLVLFSLVAGSGGGMLAFVGLSEMMGGSLAIRRRACRCALALLILGGAASVAHLASPLHAISAVTNLLSFSGISIELMLLGANFILGVAYLVLVREENTGGAVKAVAVLSVAAGLAIGFFCGHGYVIEAQPTWDTETLPLAYLGTSIALGAFAYAALAYAADKSDAAAELGGRMQLFVLASAAIGAIGIVAYAAAIGFDVAGSQGVLFWGGVVVVGAICPVACGCAAITSVGKKSPLAFAVSGGVCALVGGICLRALMWATATGFVNLFALGIPSVIMNL